MNDDTISRQAAIETVKKHYRVDNDLLEVIAYEIEALPSAQPGCEDTVPRTSVKYICRKNTVSTNPYEHKYHDKFIQFMNDPEISDFGRWQHSNGFNTALVAVMCDLDKVPSVTPKQPGWIPCSERLPQNGYWLWSANGGEVKKDFYWDGHWELAEKYGYEVLAWMPLPTPYREGGQDG